MIVAAARRAVIQREYVPQSTPAQIPRNAASQHSAQSRPRCWPIGAQDAADRGLGATQRFGDFDLSRPLAVELPDALAINHEPRPAADAPFAAGSSQAGFGAIALEDSFLLRDGRQNRQHGIFEDPAAVEVLLGIAAKTYAIAAELLEVFQRRERT